MSWQIIVIIVLGGFFVLIPFLTYLSSRRMVGKVIAGDGHTSADQLLYFYSASCGPCRNMTQIIDQLSREHDNVRKVDVMQDPDTAREYGVRATPTTILVKEHVIKEVVLGAKSQKQLEQLLAEISA